MKTKEKLYFSTVSTLLNNSCLNEDSFPYVFGSLPSDEERKKFALLVLEKNKKYEISNLNGAAPMNYWQFLEEKRNWDLLAKHHSPECFEILLKHHKYEEIIEAPLGNFDWVDALYKRGHKAEIIHYYQEKKPENNVYSADISGAEFLVRHSEWADITGIFVKGMAYLCKAYADPLLGLSVLMWQEQKGKDVRKSLETLCEPYANRYNKMFHYIENNFSKGGEMLAYVPKSLEAVEIWLYKNSSSQGVKEAILTATPWWAWSLRRKMKDENFPTKLSEIEKALRA